MSRFVKTTHNSLARNVTVSLANGAFAKLKGTEVELISIYNDFWSKEKLTVLDMKSTYDLVLGMPWLTKHQP